MSVRLILFCLWWGTAIAFGSQVISTSSDGNVQVSQDKGARWTEKDRLCLMRQDKKIACGRVIDAREDQATVFISERMTSVAEENKKDGKDESYVELIFGKAEVKKGDTVVLDDVDELEYVSEDSATQMAVDGLKGLQRRPSSLDNFYEDGKEDLLTQIEIVDDDEKVLHHEKISNLSFGIDYIFPTIQYQQALTKKFAIGLTGQSINAPVGDGSISGYGGSLSLNFYSLEAFHGTWVQVGAGMYSLRAISNAGASVDFYAPAVMFHTGWRWFFESGMNFGCALGVNYFLTSQTRDVGIEFSGLFPSVALDFGFAF